MVRVANPKTLEFQVLRTSLLAGLLKTVRENRTHPLPIRVFEASDVALKDPARERQARNERRAAAVWCNRAAGFEVVHGMLDRAMLMLEIPRIAAADLSAPTGYYIKEREGGSSPCSCAGLFTDFMQTPLSSPAAPRLFITALLYPSPCSRR